MELTLKQQQGLDITLQKHKDKEKYVVISGYAGTGKSTLVRFIVDALQVAPDKICYAAYTGKAAEVLRKKGNPNAMTLHRLLYESVPLPGGGFFRKPKLNLGYDIVVVDEVSMVPKSMLDMLLRHKIFVIFLGDPFQLPMIDKNETHDLLDHPDVFLDQIMRQAEESEIIRLTMKIRNQEEIKTLKGEEILIDSKSNLVTGHLNWADCIICATNNMRHSLNKQMRDIKGFEGPLQNGDKVIIKRNYWDNFNADGDVLVNGMIGTVSNVFDSFIKIPNFIKNNRHTIPTILCDFTPDFGKPFLGVNLDKDFLLTEEPCVDWRVSYKLGKMNKGDLLPRQGTWGYAITCHAAQGSEYDKVLVIEESFPFDKKEHARWLYTACTRASSRLVLLR